MRIFTLCASLWWLAVACGCTAGPPPPRRPVPVGGWSFTGVGDRGADHVFEVMVLPLRNGRQGARIKGVVGGAGVTRIRAAGPLADGEVDWFEIVPGDASVGRFTWEVEGLDVEGNPVRARVRVLIPRLPGHLDPDDPLSPYRVEDHELEASAEIEFAAGGGAMAVGRPPLDEPIFMTDPYER
ncbi:MAG: hypothetical protein ACYTGX_00245 [Planctomycetota bacterium]